MSKYNIKKVSDGEFVLHETASCNVIAKFSRWNDAKMASKFFSNGGGFDGWTPAFMVENRTSINKTTQQHVA